MRGEVREDTVNVHKKTLADLDSVYLVRPISLGGETHLLAATEGHGRCLLLAPPDWTPSVVWEGPGGSMDLAVMPGPEGAFLAIQDFLPVFQSADAGIVYAEAGDDPRQPWNVRRVLDLPFAHRLEIVDVGGAPHLVAGTLCAGKEFTEDWSQPGAVYVGAVPDAPGDRWSVAPVLTGISKNHGMHVTTLCGRRVVLVAGAEGLFSIAVPQTPGQAWRHERLCDHEVSEVYVGDVDGDGDAEIVAIQPFHGDSLVVHKLTGDGLQPMCEARLDFGHVAWCGTIQGTPAILAGSRAGEKSLAMLRIRPTDPPSIEEVILDRGVGPTQVIVMNEKGRDLIVAANHGAGKVDLYEIRP